MSDNNKFGAKRGQIGNEKYINADTPDYNFLHGTLPRNITPSDIDGVVECCNNFWFIEFKQSGMPIDKGQSMMLDRLAKIKNCFVTIWWHDDLVIKNQYTKCRIINPLPKGEDIIFEFDDYDEGIVRFTSMAEWFGKLPYNHNFKQDGMFRSRIAKAS